LYLSSDYQSLHCMSLLTCVLSGFTFIINRMRVSQKNTDFRTEIEIPTSTSIHKTYWLKHTETHTRRWNIHFSYAFIWKHFHLYSAPWLSVSDPHQEPKPPCRVQFQAGETSVFYSVFFVCQFKLSSIRLHTGHTGALEISNISLYQAIVWHCIQV